MSRRVVFLSQTEDGWRTCAPVPALTHTFFGWTGLRPVLAQHTREEHAVIQKWAQRRKSIVEIGVAEGASALAIREVMAPDGVLCLIDPFHLSRAKWLNTLRRSAHAAVASSHNGHVVWIQKFSNDAAQSWNTALDFLLIDGDHGEIAVANDWRHWNQFVLPGGIALLHDARVFAGGWTNEDWGPVQLINSVRNGSDGNWKIVEEVHSIVVLERLG